MNNSGHDIFVNPSSKVPKSIVFLEISIAVLPTVFCHCLVSLSLNKHVNQIKRFTKPRNWYGWTILGITVYPSDISPHIFITTILEVNLKPFYVVVNACLPPLFSGKSNNNYSRSASTIFTYLFNMNDTCEVY